jgi:hypothetical protein
MTDVTMRLTEDQHYAAVYAVVDDMKSMADTVHEQVTDFVNTFTADGYEPSIVAASDVAGTVRMMANLLPALDALVHAVLPGPQSSGEGA